tara:strand:- start:1305 stop:1598 length:294 start_codon:yes stop_codon:yes gene_type:complete
MILTNVKKNNMKENKLMVDGQEKAYDPLIGGPVNFMDEFAEILGQHFLCVDMIDQDTLFEMQDKLAILICATANSQSSYTRRLASKFIELNPVTFKT